MDTLPEQMLVQPAADKPAIPQRAPPLPSLFCGSRSHQPLVRIRYYVVLGPHVEGKVHVQPLTMGALLSWASLGHDETCIRKELTYVLT